MFRGNASVRHLVVAFVLLSVCAVGLFAGGDDVAVIDDFETDDHMEGLFAVNGNRERFEGEFAAGKYALRWTVGAGFDPATLSFGDVVEDVREFATISWRWRFEGLPPPKLYCELASKDGSVICVLPPPTSEWDEQTVPIGEMREVGSFCPKTVEWFEIICFQPQPFIVEFDDVRLLKGEGGWRGPNTADEPCFTIGDFESGISSAQIHAEGCRAEVVEIDGSEGGHALRWTQKPSMEGGDLALMHLPTDVSPYRKLTCRARKIDGRPGDVYVRLSGGEGILEADLPELGEEWQELVFWLPEMRDREGFDPKVDPFMRLVCFETGAFVVEFDDLILHKGGDGCRYSARERLALGIDTTAPVYRIADFDRERAMSGVIAEESGAEMFALKRSKPEEGCALRWAVARSARESRLNLMNIPGDVSTYRTLRLRARINRKQDRPVEIRIRSGGGALECSLDGLGKRWKSYEFPLPKMQHLGEFDPKDVVCLRFGYGGGKGFDLDLDDVELVKGAGGWEKSGDQHLADVFGEKRYRKAKEIGTDHFTIWTDSKAAQKKFPKALEKTYDFACKALGLEGFEGKLPVYIFQSSTLYEEFCVRKGWDVESARATAGHASQTYFATYYQAPESAVVTHELTHSIFQRTLGDGGGSWFQEGAAVYVEELWQKRSAAELFAPKLRSREFLPLPQLIATRRLADAHDQRGGAGSGWALYAQAGAFFEFLLRGPYAKLRPNALKAFAVLDESKGDVVEEVERILGASIDEIEDLWVEWGGNPPKAKRR